MKKITSMFLTILMVSTFMVAVSMFPSTAVESDATPHDAKDEEFDFNRFLADLEDGMHNSSTPPLKDSRIISYKLYDMEGDDVTDSFRAQAANAESADKLYYMYLNNIAYAVKRTEIVTHEGDLTKTVEEEIDRVCMADSSDMDLNKISEAERNGRVFYRLKGTITYDPVTYKITSASPVIRTYIKWYNWHRFTRPYTTHEISETPIIAPDGNSAAFDHTMKISANFSPEGFGLGNLDYGTFSHSFKIEAD